MSKIILFTKEQKLAILEEAKSSGQSVKSICEKFDISRSKYNGWKKTYETEGPDGLKDDPGIEEPKEIGTTDSDYMPTVIAEGMIGKTYDDFEIMERIGLGGMGVVYRARQLSLQRDVALKVIREEYSSDVTFTERFRREALAAAQLNHPNIVQIYTIGKIEKMNYYTMELIRGTELSDIMKKEGTVPVDRTVEIISEICKALDYAHRYKVVHRDIKPNNVVINDEGTTKILDFGIAKAGGTATITATGLMVGTPQYMSPEQAEGKEIDGRSDIYALGVMFYEMITGKLPFKAETPIQTLYKHVHEPPTPPRTFNHNIPDTVQTVVLKALEKNPVQRYQTGRQMLDDLKAVGSSISMSPGELTDFQETKVVITEGIVAPSRRNKSRLKPILLGSLLAILIGSGAFFAYDQILNKKVDQPSITGDITDEPPVSSFVELVMSSIPDSAEVQIDGKFVGLTPTRSKLKPGKHLIKLSRQGYAAVEEEVALSVGQDYEKEFSLTEIDTTEKPSGKTPDVTEAKKFGTIKVSSKPWAKIFLDGIEKGTTPTLNEIKNVPPGTHEIRFVHADYPEHSETVHVTENKETVISHDFAQRSLAATGSVSIACQYEEGFKIFPVYAEIFIDGQPRELSPKVISGLTVGKHRIEVRKPGFKSTTRNVTVTERRTEKVIITMTKE